jgi:hypothetical protein
VFTVSAALRPAKGVRTSATAEGLSTSGTTIMVVAHRATIMVVPPSRASPPTEDPMTPRFGAVGASLLLLATTEACTDVATTAPRKAVAIPSAVGAANSTGLQLRIGSFGDGTKAQWKSGEGLTDAKGSRSQALLLQKITLTSSFSASYAIVKGLDGLPPSALSLLAWEHRDDTWCGAGAPRWNVGITGATGNSYTVFLGCAAAAKSTVNAGWTRHVWSQAAIAAEIAAQIPSGDANGGRIASLVIIFDEGIDIASGFVFLDNITVNGKVFTSSSD